MPELRMLVVDDDEPFRTRLARALRARGLDIREASGPAEALASLAADPPDRVLVDLRMPEGSGLEVVDAARALDPPPPVVVLTGYGSIATALEAVRHGARHYLTKPVEIEAILAAFDGDGPGEPPGPEGGTPSLDRVAWEHIQRVLGDCDGNISEAARRLGIHRRSLQRKLDRHAPRR